MAIHRLSTMNCTAVVVALTSYLTSGSPNSYITLRAPNGGEKLEAGSIYTIQWHVVIPDDFENWDLWWSYSGPDGPWIEIAMDLPAGGGGVDNIHTYDWIVPDIFSYETRVRVRMDNSGADYEDISNGDFFIYAIKECPWDLDGDGDIGVSDLLLLLAYWGDPFGLADLLDLLSQWGPDCN